MIHSLISLQYNHPLSGGPIRCFITPLKLVLLKNTCPWQKTNTFKKKKSCPTHSSSQIPIDLLHKHYQMVAYLVGLSVAKMEQSIQPQFSFYYLWKTQMNRKTHHNFKSAHTHSALEKQLLLKKKKTHTKQKTNYHHTFYPQCHVKGGGEISNCSNSLTSPEISVWLLLFNRIKKIYLQHWTSMGSKDWNLQSQAYTALNARPFYLKTVIAANCFKIAASG